MLLTVSFSRSIEVSDICTSPYRDAVVFEITKHALGWHMYRIRVLESGLEFLVDRLKKLFHKLVGQLKYSKVRFSVSCVCLWGGYQCKLFFGLAKLQLKPSHGSALM